MGLGTYLAGAKPTTSYLQSWYSTTAPYSKLNSFIYSHSELNLPLLLEQTLDKSSLAKVLTKEGRCRHLIKKMQEKWSK